MVGTTVDKNHPRVVTKIFDVCLILDEMLAVIGDSHHFAGDNSMVSKKQRVNFMKQPSLKA